MSPLLSLGGVYVESILPGSIEEHKATSQLTTNLKSVVDWVKSVEIPVYTWSSECNIECNNESYECIALPYSPPIVIEINPTTVKHIWDLRELKKSLNGHVILTKYPENHAELKWSYYILSNSNIELLVFYTNRDFIKADVVLGTPGFTFNPSTSPKIPAICVSNTVADLITKKRVVLRVKSQINSGIARIVFAGINGRGEREVHIVSHHDSIIGGFEKTSSSLLVDLSRSIRGWNSTPNLVLISSSARDIGDRQFTEYHYMWGLRYLLELFEKKGLLSRVQSALAIGPVYDTTRVKVIIHPLLRQLILSDNSSLGIKVDLDFNHALFESYIYVLKGIPALTITTLPYTWWCHNSTLNCMLRTKSTQLIEFTIKLLRRLLEYEYPARIRELDNHVIKSLGEVRVEIRALISRIRSLSRVFNAEKYLGEVTKLSYGLFYVMCSEPFTTIIESDMLVELSQRSILTLQRLINECKGDLLIGNSNWYVLARSKPEFLKEVFLDAYIEKTVKNRNSLIDSSISEFICREVLKGLRHGVEEHRDK
jgi:Iap family predicted aminopeptidase